MDQRFCVADLNAIETRVGAWFAGCEALLDVFKNKRDPYLDFASKMYGVPYDKLWDDYRGKNGPEAKIAAKRMRQVAKPGVLGAIYRMGGGKWGINEDGDRYKTGLWGYAEGMGIDMSQEQAGEVVKIFRNAYPEICGNGYNGEIKGIWIQLEEAVADVLNGDRTVRKIGPFGCVTIDKVTIDGRDPMLRIQLPSGSYLHYLDARMRQERMPWRRTNPDTGEDEDVYRWAFTYYGMDQDTHAWVKIVSHGGHIFENIVQGIARDVLADKLLEFEAARLPVVAHVHDEGVCQTQDDPFAPGVMQMESIMNQPVTWAPTLPLGSDGFESYFYHK